MVPFTSNVSANVRTLSTAGNRSAPNSVVSIFVQPVIKKEIQLTPRQLKAFEGKYRFQFEKGKDAFLQITAGKDHLVLKQLWDGKEISFVPESELEFFCKDKPFPLKFIKDKNGNVIQMLAFDKDLWEKVKE